VQRAVSGLRHHCTKNRADIRQVLANFTRGEPYVGMYRGRPNGYVLDNFSTRLLSCPYGWSDSAFQQCAPELATTKRMVTGAMFVGLTERYLQSWCMFAFEMNDRPIQCQHTCPPATAAAPEAHFKVRARYGVNVHDEPVR
jgi:hypothetical protein